MRVVILFFLLIMCAGCASNGYNTKSGQPSQTGVQTGVNDSLTKQEIYVSIPINPLPIRVVRQPTNSEGGSAEIENGNEIFALATGTNGSDTLYVRV